MAVQKIEIKKIISRKDFHTECIVCHRQLKRSYETNIGPMGLNCFLRAIGKPVIKNSNRVKINKLPVECFEGIAKEFILKITSMDIEKLAIMVAKIDQHIPQEETLELEFPIRIKSFMHFRYYTKKDEIANRLTWRDASILLNEWHLGRILGFDADIIERVRETQSYNKFFHSCCNVAQKNPCGLDATEWANQ